MVSSKLSDNYPNKIITKGVLQGTLLLILLCLSQGNLWAHHRDTLGTGHRVHFIQNQGQWDAPFLFKAQMHQATLFAEPQQLTILLYGHTTDPIHSQAHSHHHTRPTKAHAYRVQFVNSNPLATITPQDIDPQGGYDNYFLSNDSSRWATHLPHYYTLYYRNLYPGIDMDVQAAQNALKSNLYIAPEADPTQIVLRYDGAQKLYLSAGNLIIRTSIGEIVELAPYAYQETDTGRCTIAARFIIKGNEVRFALDNYNKSLPLTIDPILHFSTYTGSAADNWGTTATYDSEKNTYTAGIVFGEHYPTSVGAYDTTLNGNADIGIFKFDPTGSQRIYSTYLGGELADMPHSMYVNSYGELVLLGTTGSENFPTTPNAFDRSFNGGTEIRFEGSSSIHFRNGSDLFVSRFSSDGTQLLASTYVGGCGNDGLNYRESFGYSYSVMMFGNDSLYFNYGDGARGELITDDLNNVYVGSTTFSIDFPTTPGSVHPNGLLKQSGIVFKLDYNLRNMIWSTYLGGNGNDAVYSIDVDSAYNLLVCGGTTSTNFPTTPDAFQPNYAGGSTDGFVAKISRNGESLMHSTYFGSDKYDQLYFVRNGSHNDVFVYGQTKALGSTMIYNANYNTPGAGMLLARFNPQLSSRRWSTVFGTNLGHPNLSPTAFAVDICSRIYAVGWGRDFVGYSESITWNTAGTTGMETTSNAYQSTTDGQDFYIMSLDENASHLEYATFFGELHSPSSPGGSDHVDGGTSRIDKLSTLYQSVCASCGSTQAFPTTAGVWSRTNQSQNCNNAVFRYTINEDYPVAECNPPQVGCAPYEIHFTNTGRGTTFHWDFGDGTTSTQRNPVHTYTQGGTYTLRLIATMPTGCRVADTAYYTIRVLDNTGHRYQVQAACEGESTQIGVDPMMGCNYYWHSPDVSDNQVANPYVTTSGTYVLQISTPEGCSEMDTFDVHFHGLIDTVLVISPTCPGGSDGRVQVILQPGMSDSATYFWDNIPGDSILTGCSADSRPHTLRVESMGCSSIIQYAITDPPSLEYKVNSKTTLCTPQCDGFIELSYGYPNYFIADTLIDSLCAGTYTIDFYDTVGCPYSQTVTILVDSSLWHMRVWADSYEFWLSESVQLHATPGPGLTYSWTDPSTLDAPLTNHPIATPIDTVSTYTCYVTSPMGCTWQGSLALHCTQVSCDRTNIFIPNAFSPNGDGINDRLTFRGQYVTDFYIAIYSRWGEKVWETHSIHDTWDGRYNGNLCLPGVYTYYCKVKCEAGFENLFKGDITIIR